MSEEEILIKDLKNPFIYSKTVLIVLSGVFAAKISKVK